MIEKRLFVKFRNLELTQEQLKTRSVQFKSGYNEVIVDDLRDVISPRFFLQS